MSVKETEIEFVPADFSLKDKQYLSIDILVGGQRIGNLYLHDPVIENAYQLPVYLDYDLQTNKEVIILIRQAVAEKLGIEPSLVKSSPWRK